MSVVTAMGKYTNVQTEYAIKENLPRDATNITAQIIIGTPGTMMDLIRRKVRKILWFPLSLISPDLFCETGPRCHSCQGICTRRGRQHARSGRVRRPDAPCQEVHILFRLITLNLSLTSCQAFSLAKVSKSSSSRPPSRTMSEHSPLNLPQIPTRSSCRKRS